MRVHLVHAHPVETSFAAALRDAAAAALTRAGHAVDLLDLYAEGFDPVLSRAERLGYHDSPANRAPVENYVARLEAAEALVIVAPVWNFGPPAVLKGWLDRVWLPEVTFTLREGRVAPALTRVRRLSVVATYGGPRWRALAIGDPARRWYMGFMGRVAANSRRRYLAIYDMNRADAARRGRFLARVERHMERL